MNTTANTASTGMPAIQRGSMPRLPWIGVKGWMKGEDAPADAAWRASALDMAPEAWQRAALVRRRWLMFWVLAATAFSSTLLWKAQPVHGPAALQWAQMGLFALLFAWVSAGCVTAVMGFIVTLKGDPHALSAKSAGNTPIGPDARTAVIMPICNEDVATVFAGLRATCESIAGTGAQRIFDVFVLSDTSDADLRAAELQAWQALREALKGQGSSINVYYRWRQRRTHRKAGNVADFCRRWGKSYRYMVVLDADSVMSGDSLVTLVRLMEKHPRAGILQTAPRAVGLDTLHARAQQFASRVTGRLFTAGMQYWQLGEAHYWGHNAIIRVQPFMQHCGLAALPGTGSLSGGILSHDFVEAALMRRAGYQVWLVNDLAGSYEQQPPHLLAELQRDRRWCQGNLQNARLIAEPGLHGVHRAMLATGAMAYLSAPLWLLYVALGSLLWMTGGHELANVRQVFSPLGVAGLWAATASMLALPRVLAVLAVFWRGEQDSYGGGFKLVGSAVFEALLSMLQAPVRMAAHSLFTIGALTGWKLEWKSPPREATDVSWREATQRFGSLSGFALALLAAVLLLSPTAGWWLMPMAAPLLLAVPFTVLSSRSGWGGQLRRAGWLMIPEESSSPSVLQRAWGYARQPSALTPVWSRLGELKKLATLAREAMGARHTTRGLRGESRLQRVQQLMNPAQAASGTGLSGGDRMRFLSEPHSLQMLHTALACMAPVPDRRRVQRAA